MLMASLVFYFTLLFFHEHLQGTHSLIYLTSVPHHATLCQCSALVPLSCTPPKTAFCYQLSTEQPTHTEKLPPPIATTLRLFEQ
jgi:hypothetical protein